VVFLACVHLALFLALSLISPGNSLVSSWFDLDATRQRKLLRDDTASALALPASDEGAALLQLPTWPVQALSRHVTCLVRPDWSAAQTTVVTSPWRVTRASREGGRISSQPTTADKHVENRPTRPINRISGTFRRSVTSDMRRHRKALTCLLILTCTLNE